MKKRRNDLPTRGHIETLISRYAEETEALGKVLSIEDRPFSVEYHKADATWKEIGEALAKLTRAARQPEGEQP